MQNERTTKRPLTDESASLEKQSGETDSADTEKRYRLIAESSNDWEFWMDAGGRFLYNSPFCKRITGYDPDEFDADPDLLFRIVHPEDRPRFDAHRRSVHETDGSRELEFRIIDKDGGVRWIAHVCWSVRDEEGRYAGVRVSSREITERKHMEDALREREHLHRLVEDHVSDLIWTMDTDMRMTYVSPSVERLRGFTAEEVMRQTVEESMTPASLAVVVAAWEEELNLERSGTADPHRSRTFELEYYCKDGSTVWVESSMTTLRDANGAAIGILGVSRDVTERRKTDAKLHESERQLRALIEAVTEAVFLMDAEGNIVYANETTARRLRMDPAQLLEERNMYRLIPPDIAPTRWKHFVEVRETCRPLCFEDERAGRTILNSFYPILGEDGRVTYVAVFALDVTERRQADEILRKSEERYRSLFENNHAVMLLLDPDSGAIVDANAAARAYYGWSRRELTEMNINAINTMTAEEIRREMQSARREQRNRFFFRHRRADGTVRDVEVLSGPMRLKGRELLCSIIHDVTDHKRLEEELQRARKLESVGTLAAGIAHDFNNLLTAVQGYMELARTDIPSGSPGHYNLLAAERAAVQAAELTKRLITFAKGGAPVRKPCNVSELARETVQAVPAPASVEKRFVLDRDAWQAEVDEGQMGQVVRNIVENALEAMTEGGVLTLRVRNTVVSGGDPVGIATGRYVRISLEDTGKGISAEDLPHIFDPYYSTKERGAQKGMGLGLAVCYSIVDKHDGCIRVESRQGAGSVFHIYLPVAAQEHPPEMQAEDRPEPEWTGKKILLMDDEAMVRDVTGRLLTVMGYEVETVADGQEAVDRYRTARESGRGFDMVILDLTCKGGMGGVPALAAMREIDPAVKAVVFSGYIDDPVMIHYEQYGFLGAIMKPFTGQTLQTILEKYL